jgi:hypothetical protein
VRLQVRYWREIVGPGMEMKSDGPEGMRGKGSGNEGDLLGIAMMYWEWNLFVS